MKLGNMVPVNVFLKGINLILNSKWTIVFYYYFLDFAYYYQMLTQNLIYAFSLSLPMLIELVKIQKSSLFKLIF